MDTYNLPKILEPNPFQYQYLATSPYKTPLAVEFDLILPPLMRSLNDHGQTLRDVSVPSISTDSFYQAQSSANFPALINSSLKDEIHSHNLISNGVNEKPTFFGSALITSVQRSTTIKNSSDNAFPKPLSGSLDLAVYASRKKNKKRMTREMRKLLENWLMDHLDNPTFSEADKKELFQKGLTQKQLTNWMNYAKKTRLKEMKNAKSSGQDSSSS